MNKISLLIVAVIFASCRDAAKQDADNLKNEDSTLVLENKVPNKPITSKADSKISDSEIKLSSDPELLQRASVGSDSIIRVTSDIKLDYRIFGFEKPDTNSRKMVLFSVFTPDVENNPYKCPFGSYYGTLPEDEMEIKFTAKVGDYVKATVSTDEKRSAIYFHKDWIEFRTPGK